MFKISNMLLSLCLILSINACSNQQIYEGVQSNRKQECDREPTDVARAECLQGLGADYEVYKRQRESLPKNYNAD